jgi:hypothetical protein
MNLIKLLSVAEANKGATYNVNTGEINPSEGYMVATEGNEFVSGMLTQDVVQNYVNSHSSLLCEPNRYLGIWWDGMNWVLDVAEIFEEKRNAIFFGIVRNQLAIWDNTNRREITIR